MQRCSLQIRLSIISYFHAHRASDPEEIYKIHNLKLRKEHQEGTEAHLDQLITLCKQELSLLTENQENWQYPFTIIICT